MKISELSDESLDLAVSKCECRPITNISCDWKTAGEIIERENISITCFQGIKNKWAARTLSDDPNWTYGKYYYASNPIVASMRCYIASKLGNVDFFIDSNGELNASS